MNPHIVDLQPYVERLVASLSFRGHAAAECPDVPLEELAELRLMHAINVRRGAAKSEAEKCEELCAEFERDDADSDRTARTFAEHRADIESAIRVNRDMASLISDSIFKRAA